MSKIDVGDNEPNYRNRSIGCSIIVGLLILAGLFLIFRMGAFLVILLALICFLCYVFVNKDDPPFEATRVGGVILLAWAADAFLYLMALGLAPREYRHMTFGIIALSVSIGWLAWRITAEYVTPLRRRPNGTTINRSAPFTSILLGLFVMTNLVHPAIDHYFPSFCNYAASQIGQPSDDSPDR